MKTQAANDKWTSYRDGRRVMHYMRASGGRYFVQKVRDGYNVSFLADEGDGVSVRLSTEATLAAGKKWVADHLAAAPTLSAIAAKFDSSAPPFSGPSVSQVEAGLDKRASCSGVKVKLSGIPMQLPPGVYSAKVDSVSVDDREVTITAKRVARTWIFPMRNGIRSIMVGQRENK